MNIGKRLGILLLIFNLLLISPIHNPFVLESKGGGPGPYDLAVMTFAGLIAVGLIHDLLTDRCSINWHPGDYYYEKNYILIKPIKIKVQKCYNKCIQKSMNQNVGMGSLRNYKKDETGNFNECFNPCFKETMKTFPTSVATCALEKSDNYYTDGSYYNPSYVPDVPLLKVIFANKNKLRDSYEKTEWQKARDQCMEITSKKKGKFFESVDGQFHRMFGLYNECLKERGY